MGSFFSPANGWKYVNLFIFFWLGFSLLFQGKKLSLCSSQFSLFNPLLLRVPWHSNLVWQWNFLFCTNLYQTFWFFPSKFRFENFLPYFRRLFSLLLVCKKQHTNAKIGRLLDLSVEYFYPFLIVCCKCGRAHEEIFVERSLQAEKENSILFSSKGNFLCS